MNTCPVSVIVPIYKAEYFLHKCIDSILSQTFSAFELILVEDGSPDASGRICDDYAKKDRRISVIHKKNGGVSTARNCGILAAKSDWIIFVDADDWLDSNYLESFLSYQELDPKKLLFQGYKRVLKNQIEVYCFRQNPSMAVSDMIKTNNLLAFWGPVGKLFSLKIVQEKKIFFPEGIPMGEDAIFFYRYLEHITDLDVLSECGYNYRDALNSATKNIYSWKLRYKCSKEVENVAKNVINKFFPKNSMYKKKCLGTAIYSHRISALRDVYSGKYKKRDRVAILKKLFPSRMELMNYFYPFSYYNVVWIPMMLLPRIVFDLYMRLFSRILGWSNH